MNTGLVSSRYAKALMEFASLRGKSEEVFRDVVALDKALADTTQMKNCVAACCDETHTFLNLVIRNDRVSYLKFILPAYISMYRKANGITSAQLKTASPSPKLEQQLNGLLASLGYTKVDFETEVDPDILGGFVLRIDDKRLDASLATQLRSIAKEFEEKNRRIV